MVSMPPAATQPPAAPGSLPDALVPLSPCPGPGLVLPVMYLQAVSPVVPPCSLAALPAGLSTAMELIWHGEFEKLFRQYYPHTWVLQPADSPPATLHGLNSWRVFKDSAKVRFSCSDCGHGWTSMKGRVVFWFRLDAAGMLGSVLFRLYGQMCQRCDTGRFENAMWYPEEVLKVVGNVYNRVGQVYYGFYRPPLRVDRRQGKPRDQHNAQHCEACREGLCREEWTFS